MGVTGLCHALLDIPCKDDVGKPGGGEYFIF
jgi:hypothetical protein